MFLPIRTQETTVLEQRSHRGLVAVDDGTKYMYCSISPQMEHNFSFLKF